MSTKAKMPTTWKVPDGFVLTWFPPFTFEKAFPVRDDHAILVYDEDEPFIPLHDLDGNVVGYNPNVVPSKLDRHDGVHPGVYALSIQGEELPDDQLHADAVRVYGKKVSQ